MNCSNPRSRYLIIVLAACLILPCFAVVRGSGAEFGRLSGTVTDTQGTPLLGATVIIIGPASGIPYQVEAAAERVITDAHGKFTVEHLVPGWYSLRVISPTRLPVLRNGIRVNASQTSREKFALSDIFSPLHFQVPSTKAANWGDNWKWVLRTSGTTRPVLRYQEVARVTTSPEKASKRRLPASRRLIGMTPGSTRHQALAGDPGLGSVLAYLRPLSEDSDLLVAGSMTADGLQASSLATSFRKHLLKGDPQELALVVHQLSFSEGSPLAGGTGREGLARAQGVVVSYSNTRRLTDSVTLTSGFEIDYLNAARDVVAASPRMRLEYRVNPATSVSVRYGTVRLDDGSSTLLERIGVLNGFPRITIRGYRLRLEELNHTEVSVQRKLSKSSRVEIAGYRDYFHNAAVWGIGAPGSSASMASSLLPNPSGDGVVFNAGDYRSSGLRATYSLCMGSRLEAAFDYTLGEALAVDSARLASDRAQGSFQGMLRPERSQSFGGKVSTRIPISSTRITTSYQWLQPGRLTGVDPYGQADLQLEPFLGVQIRQPLPTLAFLPAHIEALADFRNLLGQGSVPLPRSNGKPFLLTSAYRSFRGGFSVQF